MEGKLRRGNGRGMGSGGRGRGSGRTGENMRDEGYQKRQDGKYIPVNMLNLGAADLTLALRDHEAQYRFRVP